MCAARTTLANEVSEGSEKLGGVTLAASSVSTRPRALSQL
jgi:hypothetical protein